MEFEAKVLSTVRKFDIKHAEFFNGSLFVECDIPEAVRIETALKNSLNVGIILSRVGCESAYDFV